MKRFIVACIVMLAALQASAQHYAPTTTWPYLYPDFTQGELLTQDGKSIKTELNVHVLRATLHYIDGDFIKELAPGTIFSASIGGDTYINAGGRMMKVLARNDNGYVAECSEVDIVKLNSTDAAYGSSSTTLGTMSLSSLEGIGATNSSTNINHMELKNSKENGKTLPLITKKYIFVNRMCIYATKRDVLEVVEPAGFKAFLKANKVKWNDPQSLLSVVDYLAENK